jgi:tetratricopeptide (TPR) repeat protein
VSVPRSTARISPQTLWTIVVFVVAAGLFTPSLTHEFVFDDDIEIVRNEHIRSLENLPEIFSTTVWTGGGRETYLYRPLAITSYAVNYALAGLEPWSFHLVNVLLHGMIAALVFVLGRQWRLSSFAAGMGALFFALHPVHVEAVAAVAGRKELLAALFTLAMVLSHPWATRRRWPAALVPAAAYGAAMLSKEVGVVGLGLVVAQDLFLGQDRGATDVTKRRMAMYAAYAGLLSAYLVARTAVVGGLGLAEVPFIDNPAAHAPTTARVVTAIGVVGRGLALLVAPVTVSPDYSYDVIPVADTVFAGWFVITVVVFGFTGALLYRFRTQRPLWILAASWYGLSLFPASNVLVPTGTIFGERLLYLPSVAFALAFGAGLAAVRARTRSRTVTAAAVLLMAALGFRASSYLTHWSDDTALFQHAVRSVPTSAKAQYALGNVLFVDGRSEEAIPYLRTAVEIYPRYYLALVRLADIYREREEFARAHAYADSALVVTSKDAEVLYGKARVLRDQGRVAEATDYWLRTIEVDPAHAGALSDLGALALMQGDPGGAVRYLERAVDADSGMASAWYNLGLTYRSVGDSVRARSAFEQFLRTTDSRYEAQAAEVRRQLGLP